MSGTPPAISPRSRNRPISVTEAELGPTSLASATRRVAKQAEAPALRVLIRLPNIVASTAEARWRLPFAVIMAKLQRKYAIAAFAVFAFCLIAIVVKHRRPKPNVQELGGDAPAWTGAAVTPSGGGSTPTTTPTETAGPIFPQAAGKAGPTVGPGAGPAFGNSASGNSPAGTAAPAATPAAAMNWQPPAGPGSAPVANPLDRNDHVPDMAAHNPSRPTGAEVRTAQLPATAPVGAGNFGGPPPSEPGAARFNGTILRPSDAPASSTPPPWPYR